jgi:hypothetical protein
LAADELLLEHRKRLLSQAIWWYTECDGKFTTRYRSEEAIGEALVPIRHEHVVQRKGQIERMLAHPYQVDEVLASSLACVVSVDEHDRLKLFDHLDGWARYAAAGTQVYDMSTATPIDLSTLIPVAPEQRSAAQDAIGLGLRKRA